LKLNLGRWLSSEPNQVIPLADERARLLREIGTGLTEQFDGQAANLIRSANRSAVRLVQLVTAHFPGFRDHAIYRGQQSFFYKRAQIFVGDVWGAYEHAGLGEFHDIDQLTCFADYRVPQLLRPLGIITYVGFIIFYSHSCSCTWFFSLKFSMPAAG
jgi:hypothetical protein